MDAHQVSITMSNFACLSYLSALHLYYICVHCSWWYGRYKTGSWRLYRGTIWKEEPASSIKGVSLFQTYQREQPSLFLHQHKAPCIPKANQKCHTGNLCFINTLHKSYWVMNYIWKSVDCCRITSLCLFHTSYYKWKKKTKPKQTDKQTKAHYLKSDRASM